MQRLIAASVIALSLAASASAETRAFTGFTGINAMNGVQVEVTQGEAFAVRVEGPEANRVATRMDGNSLRITRVSEGWFGDHDGPDAIVHVTMPRVASIAVARGAQVRVTNLRAGALSVAASQGGQLDVAGACTRLTAAVSMGGQIDADGLDCEAVNVSASMGGSASVHATQSLTGSASMGGNVDVSGNPARRDVSASMGGSID